VLPWVRPLRLTTGQLLSRKVPQVARLFWTYLLVVIGSVVLAVGVFGRERLHWAMFVADGAIFVTTCFFATSYWRSLRPQLSRFGFGRWEAWAALAALVPLLALNYGYHSFLTGSDGGSGEGFLHTLREAGLSTAALVFLVAIFPAVSEELAFRGLVQHWLLTAVSPARAMVISAALFAVIHLSILSVPYLFLVGLLLGWVKWRTGSLYPCMAVHFFHNFAVLELLPT